MDGCASLFRCDKGMCVSETSQRFAVAKAVIGISDGICNAFSCKSGQELLFHLLKTGYAGYAYSKGIHCGL